MKINLKYHPQHKDYTCGPACLRMVFEHLGKKYSEEKLANLCQTSERYGTSHQHLISVIKKEKFKYLLRINGSLRDLIDCVEAGYLVIINYLDPFSNEGHYAVVTGYANDEKEIILADPCNGNDFTIPWHELKERWRNNNNTSQGWLVVIGRESVNM